MTSRRARTMDRTSPPDQGSSLIASEQSLSDDYVRNLRRRFPSLRILEKDHSALCRLIDGILRVVTFGGQSAFMTNYVTTLRRTIYVPPNWSSRSDVEKYITLRHEAIHLEQFRRYTAVGMGVLYVLPILPLGLAWCRARLEWEAYAETLRAMVEVHGIESARDERLHRHIVRQFVSAAYGWMWPFPRTIQRWIDAELERLERAR
jgi:hypothetical protein